MLAYVSRATPATRVSLDIIHNPQVGMTGPVISKDDQRSTD